MSPRAPLAALPGLLAGEAAIAELFGIDDAIVAVPAAARAVVLAALAELGASPMLLVATATAREAEQLVHDLVPFLGDEAVELLPAWETLPFERVSPATETMGRRLRTMWRLRNGLSAGAAPAGTRRRCPDPRPVATARAASRRRGTDRRPAGRGAGPRGSRRTPGPCRLPARVPGRGARRVRRAGRDRRRLPLDRGPGRPDRPVRRRGRAADRLRRRGPAFDRRPRAGRDLRLSRGRAHRGGARARSAAVQRGPIRSGQLRPHRRRGALRRHGVVAALAQRGGAPVHRSPRRARPGRARRAPPPARPGDRAPRRGGGARREPGDHVGAEVGRCHARDAAACTSDSTACWRGPPPRWPPCSPWPRARGRSRSRPRAGRRCWATRPGSPGASASSPAPATVW